MTSSPTRDEGTGNGVMALSDVLKREQRLLRALVVQLRALHHGLVDEADLVPADLVDAVEGAEYTLERLGVDDLARAILVSGLAPDHARAVELTADDVLALVTPHEGDVLRSEVAALRVLVAQVGELSGALEQAGRSAGIEIPRSARQAPPSLVAFLRER